MPVALITGANRGLGLEFVRQYANDGWHVIACCRAPEQSSELNALEGDIDVRALDVADFSAIDGLASDLQGTAIDVLVANAGIYGKKGSSLRGVDYDEWMDVFRINTQAPLKIVEAFCSHVAASEGKRLVALTSKMGSVTENSSGGSYVYRSSKAALNAVMKSAAIDLSARGVLSCVLHPGWVRTDMGGPQGLIDAPESVAGMRAVIQGLTQKNQWRLFRLRRSRNSLVG